MERFDDPTQLQRRTRLNARLVFDTADRALPSGARLRESASRHLLYEIADLCLDLRLDHPPQSATATLIGQLADRQDPLKPLAGLPVFLFAGEDLLAQTKSNRLGEFQMECEPASEMNVCLAFGEENLIEVPVNPPIGEAG